MWLFNLRNFAFTEDFWKENKIYRVNYNLQSELNTSPFDLLL